MSRKKTKSLKKSGASPLILAAGKLKEIRRSGWVKKVGIKPGESVADHSYRMALLGAVIAEQLEVAHPEKVVRMCLLHDLAESISGDKMPEEKGISPEAFRKNELDFIEQILITLPSKSRELLLKDARELMMMKTKEASLVWEIDKLEMGLQAIDYKKAGYSGKKLKPFDSRRFLSTPYLARILDLYRENQ